MDVQAATYTFRSRTDGTTHEIPFPTLWAALNRAEYDVEENADATEPVSITTTRASFDREAILALLDIWGNPAIIKREAEEVPSAIADGELSDRHTGTAVPVAA